MKNLEQEVRKVFGIADYPQRTNLQNKSLHLYFTLLSEAFNDAGYDVKKVLDVINMGIPWTPVSAKEALWKPVMKKMLNKDSTTEMDTTDITTIHEALSLALNQRLGINVEFPSEEQTEAYLKSLKP